MKKFQYQDKKTKHYFEGWYIRLTDNTKNTNIAIIFAITKDKEDPHSFIQYYDGVNDQSFYYRYSVSDFSYDYHNHVVKIEKNHLSLNEVELKTKDVTVKGTISNLDLLKPYQGTTSAMGFLSKAPLECFQEVIYMKANTSFTIGDKTYQGIAYMEKTFGTNFPIKWIWLQSNHSDNNSTISFSVGIVPVLFLRKKGFLFILQHNNIEYRYGSFNFSKVTIEEIKGQTIITVRRKKDVILIKPTQNTTVKLVGPSKKGRMNLDVFESIKAEASITFTRNGKIILEDTYTNVGLELMYKKKG